jgi:hypothetical protein
LEWCCGNGEGEMLVVVWRPVFMQAAPYGRKENEFSFKWVLSFGCWFLEVWRKKGFCFDPCFDNGDGRVVNACVFGFMVARRR